MKHLIAILVWLCAYPLWAAYPYPYNCVCEVYNGNAGGSATVVGMKDGKGLILSCCHLFEGGVRSPKVQYAGTTARVPAKVLALDSRLDLAAMTADVPEGQVTAKCVRRAAVGDGTLTAVGMPYYAKPATPHVTKGVFLRMRGPDVMFSAKPTIHSGFSGGGLFVADGSFVGVLHSYNDERESIATSGVELEKFAARWLKVEKK